MYSNNMGENILPPFSTKAVSATLNTMDVKMYRHSNYGGWCIFEKLDHAYKPAINVANVGKSKNDKISSIFAAGVLPSFSDWFPGPQYTAVLKFYDAENYGGYCLWLEQILYPGKIDIPDLKKYKIAPGSSAHWGDRITSYQLGFKN